MPCCPPPRACPDFPMLDSRVPQGFPWFRTKLGVAGGVHGTKPLFRSPGLRSVKGTGGCLEVPGSGTCLVPSAQRGQMALGRTCAPSCGPSCPELAWSKASSHWGGVWGCRRESLRHVVMGGVAESTAPSCLPSLLSGRSSSLQSLTKRNSLARNQKGLTLKPALGSEKRHPRLYQETPQLPQDPSFSVSKTSSPPTTSGIRDLQKCI